MGICVDCRKAVCVDCITKVDGINYCVSCLAARAGPSKATRTARGSSAVVGWLATALGSGVLSLLAWSMLQVLLGRPGP